MQRQPKIKLPNQPKSGYNVWIYGNVYWHRTLEGALKRAREAHYCHNVQIIELRTNRLVRGSPE